MTLPLVELVATATLATVAASALAAAEASLSRISRSRAAELAAEGRRGASAAQRVAEDPAPTLSVTTFLRVLAETGAAVVVTTIWVDRVAPWWRGAGIALAIMTAVSFVVVRVGPRTVGRQQADRVGLVAAPVMLAVGRLFGPLTRLLVLLGNALTPGPGFRDGPFASEAELRELVDIAGESQVIEADEREMIHSVFELGDTLVREVMVPRTEIVSVERDTRLHAAMSLFLRSGFSRVPVVGDGVDDVLGMLYLKDVARRVHERPDDAWAVEVDGVMREARFVPDSKPVDSLLRQMQKQAGHIAVVVDEYGGTAGLVTLEDLVEEVIGDISDEYDPVTDEPVVPLGEEEFRVRSRLHVEELGDLYGIDLRDEEVDTVGGLMAKLLGRVPIAGAEVRVGDLVLTAERFEGRRNQLATVLVRREAAGDDEAEEADD
ncbi:MAG: hemolysin family protein [Kineosporiaceae bacterium]